MKNFNFATFVVDKPYWNIGLSCLAVVLAFNYTAITHYPASILLMFLGSALLSASFSLPKSRRSPTLSVEALFIFGAVCFQAMAGIMLSAWLLVIILLGAFGYYCYHRVSLFN
jgi:hypothetical protein